MVSAAPDVRTVALAAALVITACAGRQNAVTATTRPASAERLASDMDADRPETELQFDNEATVYADVYLVAGPIQWKLGRVPAGMRERLTVPESAIDWPTGFMQLVVISGSLMSAEASRDPRAIIANAQPISEVLAQRWTFHQPAGAALQLQATRLAWRY
jgi:hypothetical protein